MPNPKGINQYTGGGSSGPKRIGTFSWGSVHHSPATNSVMVIKNRGSRANKDDVLSSVKKAGLKIASAGKSVDKHGAKHTVYQVKSGK